jgi:hypothetical protein
MAGSTGPIRTLLIDKVMERCGPSDKFGIAPAEFDNWLRYGQGASDSTTNAVLPQLAEYLARARAVGITWGLIIGTTMGLFFALVAGSAAWLIGRFL